MVQQIQVNNEIIEFPDNMSATDIETVLNREFGQQSSFLDKALQFTQQLATGEPLKSIGEFAKNIPVGLGQTAIGTTQAVAQLTGQEEFAQRLGQEVKRRREEEGEISTAAKIGREAGEIILPALVSPSTLIKGGVVGGATIGATTPQEEGGLRERGIETAKGATIGGVAGGVFKAGGAIVKGIKNIVSPKKAEDIFARGLSTEQKTEALERLKAAPADSPVIFADIAGDATRGLTRAVGKLGGARDIIVDALEGRSFKAVERINKQLSKSISNVDTYFGNLDDIVKARKELASPLYVKAYKEAEVINRDKLQKLLQDQRIIDAMDLAKKEYGVRLEAPANSLETLDGVKKVLGDIQGAAIRQGKMNQSISYGKLKEQLLSELDGASKTYKKARKIFSDFSHIKDAQEQGLKFTTLRPEQLQRLFKTLPVSEKEAFRIGVRENLEKTVSSTADQADPAKRIFGSSYKRKQLRAVFSDENNFKAFTNRMNEEIAAAKTKFLILGGSRTDINIAGDSAFVETMAKLGGGIALGSRFAQIHALMSVFRKQFPGITKKNAKDLASILVKKEKSITALENILVKEKNAVQKRVLTEAIKNIKPLITVKTTQQTGE